ncbi:DUF2193 domain-containing protein [Sporomusa sphaeroides]|uniref:DUF2193 domain-containing protein n=1 Tax=Sporomusa sphaeroides TaxID=47679 RepID=UPI00202EAA38|nr:DUF2193 domain-containing protein [Sporomusa sphaeroides]MCM0759187.1 DUF2193 domain-containing protein [Sporomusa sphaeroides DSM 2875]HML35269.1 DUF2193 domain-containing protein [Sporomusa sphaeroides]
MSNTVHAKMIAEALAAQKADISVLKAKRGQTFTIADAKPYVDAVNNMTVGEGQSKEVIRLHVDSVNAHYDILSELTKTVCPEDDPFVEHYQTPAILEILYQLDPGFHKAMEQFVAAIPEHEAFIGRESARRYGGFYGPTCVVDFAFCPGSTSNAVNTILNSLNIDKKYKQAILSSKSWGMNTSYGIGAAFAAAVEAGKTMAQAVQEEIAMLQLVYSQPIEAQTKLMTDGGHSSFDVKKYMEAYKQRMAPAVKAAVDAGVHFSNIVTVPAYCVGDVAHHISQSMFNMTKDDVTMGIIEAVSAVMEKTLALGLEQGYKSHYDILSVATGSTAAATAYILEKDGFTVPMVVDLLTKRYTNYVQKYPNRGPAAELHNCDFMDMIHRGSKIIEVAPIGAGGKIKGIPVQLAAIEANEAVANPQRYTYPACAITVRFSSLMRLADFPCLLTSEPVTATLMTNIIALDPANPGSPARVCKDCAVTGLIKRHEYCNWKQSV